MPDSTLREGTLEQSTIARPLFRRVSYWVFSAVMTLWGGAYSLPILVKKAEAPDAVGMLGECRSRPHQNLKDHRVIDDPTGIIPSGRGSPRATSVAFDFRDTLRRFDLKYGLKKWRSKEAIWIVGGQDDGRASGPR